MEIRLFDFIFVNQLPFVSYSRIRRKQNLIIY